MAKKRKVVQSVVITTTREMAFEAVTRASELREWCSDEAWTQVRPGGRYDLRWNQGYRTDGQFVELDPPRRALVTWHGTGEPGETQVEFRVKPVDGGTRVKVIHRGFGPGCKWDVAVEASERGWSGGLPNLKSVLETGVDQRLARRPFLGITLDALTPERAEREGIAAERGIYVLGTAEGSGAQAAGLSRGDVIVALGGIETLGYAELGAALAAQQAGDTVEMELVRGESRESIQVTLGSRPQPEVPDSADDLADQLAAVYEQVDAELKAALVGVSEEEASQRPAEGEWSVKQVLAHLSTGERGLHTLLAHWAVNGWLDAAGGIDADAFPGQLDAVLAATPTLAGLEDRLLADEAETVALLCHLPEEALAHKPRFRRISEVVGYGPDHTREHIEQIKQALATVRQA